jgi:hypothetical protein
VARAGRSARLPGSAPRDRPPLRSGDVGTAAPAPHDPERQVRYRGREASGRRGRFRGRTEQTPSTKPQR